MIHSFSAGPMVKFKADHLADFVLDAFDGKEVGEKLCGKLLMALGYEYECTLTFKQPIRYFFTFPSMLHPYLHC